MASQITNYQCPACTGPLQFSPETRKLECEYCGSIYELAEIEALYEEKEAAAVEASQNAPADDGWGEEGMKTYSCPSCTAELICDESTAATSCPYCGNPTVVPGQFNGALKPDFVIPFKLQKENAVEMLKKHYDGRFFLPKSFKNENHIQEIQGVYVPFWLFDGEAEGDAAYEATTRRTYRAGDYEITETKHYDVARAGKLIFEKVPVDASTKMPDGHMDSIEPYDYGELQPFSTAYLPGFLADKYDVEMEDSRERVNIRCEGSLAQSLDNTVEGYSTVDRCGQNIHVTTEDAKYALLPVWMLSTKWNNQNFLFAMNGQTGKLVGDLPVDKKKYWTTFFGIGVGLSILVSLLIFYFGSLTGGTAAITIVGCFVAALIVCSILNAGMKNVALGDAADQYVSGDLQLSLRTDTYTHTTTTRRKIERKQENG